MRHRDLITVAVQRNHVACKDFTVIALSSIVKHSFYGRMPEWLNGLVLKTRDRWIRRFESCSFWP